MHILALSEKKQSSPLLARKRNTRVHMAAFNLSSGLKPKSRKSYF